MCYYFFDNAYCDPPQNYLLCDKSMFSRVSPSVAAGKMRQIQLSTEVTVLQVFKGSHATSDLQIQGQNRRYRVCEDGC